MIGLMTARRPVTVVVVAPLALRNSYRRGLGVGRRYSLAAGHQRTYTGLSCAP